MKCRKAVIEEKTLQGLHPKYLALMRPHVSKAVGRTLKDSQVKKCFRSVELIFAHPEDVYMNLNGPPIAKLGTVVEVVR